MPSIFISDRISSIITANFRLFFSSLQVFGKNKDVTNSNQIFVFGVIIIDCVEFVLPI